MLIILVIQSLRAGGAEKNISWLASTLVSEGNTVELLTFEESPPFFPLDPKIRVSSLNSSTRGLDGALFVRALFTLLLRLRKTIKTRAPDHVISFMDQANMLTIAACLGSRISTIVSERTNPERGSISEKPPLLRSFLFAARLLLYRRAKKVIVQTEGARRYFQEKRVPNVTTIPNAVIPSSEGVPFDPPFKRFILSVGRLVPLKRHDLVIEAFSNIAPTFAELHLVIVGEGPLQESLRTLALEKHLTDRIHLIGVSHSPISFMKRAEALVLASDYEGFPGVLCEAMSVGTPVIATDCPYGPSDIIRNNIDGVLVPCNDAQALGDAIASLLSDEKKRAEFAKRAREVRERFSEKRVFLMWRELIK